MATNRYHFSLDVIVEGEEYEDAERIMDALESHVQINNPNVIFGEYDHDDWADEIEDEEEDTGEWDEEE